MGNKKGFKLSAIAVAQAIAIASSQAATVTLNSGSELSANAKIVTDQCGENRNAKCDVDAVQAPLSGGSVTLERLAAHLIL